MQKFFILEKPKPARPKGTSDEPAGPLVSPHTKSRPGLEIRSAPAARETMEPGAFAVERLTAKDAASASRQRDIAAVTPVMPMSLITPLESNASEHDGNWGIAAIAADTSRYDGAGIKVAVLDTGIDAAHPAFEHASIEQKDFSGDGDGDVQGHGSHCAGTIFGRTDPRIGVAPGVKDVWIGKVLDNKGGGSSENLFRALHWAFEERVNIISMSLGFDFPKMVNDYIEEGWPPQLATSVALEAYRSNLRMFDALMAQAQALEQFGGGPLIVAAAGNESKRDNKPEYKIAISLPAAAMNVVSVAAVRREDDRFAVAKFSNTMATLSAPGQDIVSVKAGGGLRSLSGTSMACPHVAGVAALWWQSLGRTAKAGSVASRLRSSCQKVKLGPDPDLADFGEGLVTAPQV